MRLPEYAIFLIKERYREILVRKLGKKNEVGISIKEKDPNEFGDRSAEFFLNRQQAIELINALENYFNISEGDK